MDTRLLIKQAKRGNKDSLLKLVMNQESEYYKLAFVYMKNKEDALDALQDMIVLLYENIYKLKKDDAFYSWSKTILVNVCKKIIKRNNGTAFTEDVIEHTVEVYGDCEEKIVLEKYLLQLNEKHQEVIRLKYYLDLDYKTISKILLIPIGTVRSRLHIGVSNLRTLLGGDFLNG